MTVISISQFSRDENKQAAEACAITIGQAMAPGDRNNLFCLRPEDGYKRWYAIAHNYILSMSSTRMLYIMGDANIDHPLCVAVSYMYPEDTVEKEEDAPKPEGTLDISQYGRPGMAPLVQDLLSSLDQGKEEFLKEVGPFLYVGFLCTAPSNQGQGLGSQLLSHLLAKADALGKHAYLEATNEDNARLYARHGFKRRSSKTWTHPDVPGASSTLIFMSRAPLQTQ